MPGSNKGTRRSNWTIVILVKIEHRVPLFDPGIEFILKKKRTQTNLKFFHFDIQTTVSIPGVLCFIVAYRNFLVHGFVIVEKIQDTIPQEKSQWYIQIRS